VINSYFSCRILTTYIKFTSKIKSKNSLNRRSCSLFNDFCIINDEDDIARTRDEDDIVKTRIILRKTLTLMTIKRWKSFFNRVSRSLFHDNASTRILYWKLNTKLTNLWFFYVQWKTYWRMKCSTLKSTSFNEYF
jgi:hypothetical protein